jgi:hypothetical protein
MKNYRQIIFVIIINLFCLSFANAQPASGSEQSTENSSSSERRRRLPVMTETKVESDYIQAISSDVYELRCRGGKDLTFPATGTYKTHSSGAVIVSLELSFSPGLQTAGANSQLLSPGECALVTRPFYRDEVGQIREPLSVKFETPVNAQLKQTQSGSAVDKSPTAAERFPDAITIAEYLTNPNHFWSFQVVNTGKGYFEAKSHQHWKKMLQDKMLPKGRILRNF